MFFRHDFAARRFVSAAAAVSIAFAIAAAPSAVRADCSPPGGVHINEVRYVDTPTPEEGRLNGLVELFNKGGSAQALDGWEIRDHAGAVKHTFAPLSLPPGAFVLVRFETGDDDTDFSDGVGTIYTDGDSVGTFHPLEGGVALYEDSLGTPVIRDYVTWSLAGTPAAGSSLTDALARGLWTAGQYVYRTTGQSLFTIRLLPDGFDHNLETDWTEYGWSESGYGAQVPGANAIQQSPPDGAGFNPGPVTIAWSDVDSALAYHVEVATDSTFTSGIVADWQTTSLDTTFSSLPSAAYYWRVRVIDSCGEGTGATWTFAVFPFALSAPGAGLPGPAETLAPQAFGVVGVPRITQHKDSQLLCLWDDATKKRPGCTELAGFAGPWDGVHPDFHAEFFVPQLVGWRIVWQHVECPHCRNYCRRATIQMLNAYYGGNLTQDRISYQSMILERAAGNVVAAPEGDLGHDLPMLVASTGPITQWAIDNSAVTGPFVGPSFAQLKAELQAGYPVQTRVPGHALIITGFVEAGTFGANFPQHNMVHVRDPWPGPGNRDGWQRYTAVNFAGWWRIRPAGAAALAGHMQEASVTTDTDGDGVMDFDEGYPTYPADRPRKLQSKHNDNDTDLDEVGDKQDIRSYTFHDTDHAGHNNDGLMFPDHDFDGLRAELDCCTDDDGDFDGGEDVNGDGKSPAPGETDVYDAGSRRITFTTDQAVYTTLDEVMLSGDTYHANSDYTYHVYNSCPFPLSIDDPYGASIANGTISSDATGTLITAMLGQFPVGCYSVAIDIRKDGQYGHIVNPPAPDREQLCDRTTTFTVEAATATHGLHLSAIGFEGGARLEWIGLEALGCESLEIERGRAAAGPFETVATLSSSELVAGAARWVDQSLREPGRYYYRLIARTALGPQTLGPSGVDVTAPRLALAAAPNPAAGLVSIQLALPRASHARVAVYSASGRLVRELAKGDMTMGIQKVTWDGADAAGRRAPAGVYFVLADAAGAGRVQARLVRL